MLHPSLIQNFPTMFLRLLRRIRITQSRFMTSQHIPRLTNARTRSIVTLLVLAVESVFAAETLEFLLGVLFGCFGSI